MGQVTRKFKPNTPIVRVKHEDGFVKHYEIHSSVEAYIKKCESEGKQAIFMGKTDSKGKLKNIFV